MSEKQSIVFDLVTTGIGVATFGASTLDNVEQWGRIILLAVSILSGIFLVLVNWQKGIDQFKKIFR